MTPAFAQLQCWFSEEERTRCPFCEAYGAIESDRVLVCLACTAISIERSDPIRGTRQGN